MVSGELKPEIKTFLGVQEMSDSIELPPHILGLFVRPATPAGVPFSSLKEETKVFMKLTPCLPTYPNESEGG